MRLLTTAEDDEMPLALSAHYGFVCVTDSGMVYGNIKDYPVTLRRAILGISALPSTTAASVDMSTSGTKTVKTYSGCVQSGMRWCKNYPGVVVPSEKSIRP
jgi:hypothetical protein